MVLTSLAALLVAGLGLPGKPGTTSEGAKTAEEKKDADDMVTAIRSAVKRLEKAVGVKEGATEDAAKSYAGILGAGLAGYVANQYRLQGALKSRKDPRTLISLTDALAESEGESTIVAATTIDEKTVKELLGEEYPRSLRQRVRIS